MKATVLLTTTLFLVSAPSPDSDSITEISGGFLSIPDTRSLLAADASIETPTADESTTPADKPEAPPADAEIKQQETQQ